MYGVYPEGIHKVWLAARFRAKKRNAFPNKGMHCVCCEEGHGFLTELLQAL